MSQFSLPMKSLFDMFTVVQSSADEHQINQVLTDSYQKIFSGEQALFFTPDDGGFTDAVKNNIDERLNRYYKEYYYRFDPLQLMSGVEGEEAGIDVVRNIDYEPCQESEYYNDFLSPQKIHYKLLALFKTRESVLGKLLLFRSRKAGNFSTSALRDAETITPYLANAMENNRIQSELKRYNGFLRMIEDNLKTGIILLDKSHRIIHMNDRAQEICGRLRPKSQKIQNIGELHPSFVQDFYEMVEESGRLTRDDLLLPRERVFQDDSRTLSIQSKLISDHRDAPGSAFYMINVEELEPFALPASVDGPRIDYKLSDREKEVAEQVIQGLQNSEIAQNLFISEVTVKKHLQNIFQKTGVSNRAALVHTLLTT